MHFPRPGTVGQISAEYLVNTAASAICCVEQLFLSLPYSRIPVHSLTILEYLKAGYHGKHNLDGVHESQGIDIVDD
jgi:hypothetical protein